MSAICLIDTSIFVEILDVPGKANQQDEILSELGKKIEINEKLFLPMATIFETGNHIAQIKIERNGSTRRKRAQRFVSQVQKAIKGESPFQPIDFLDADKMEGWLHHFPDSAMKGMSLGDLSIIKDFEKICDQHKGWKVYIWSLDDHMNGYCKKPDI